MKKGTNKRGFIPPQPAAALSALDFAHASEAFRRALALDGPGGTEEESDAVGEVIAQCADRLIGIPTTNPAHIAEKVAAYAWLHNVSPNLSDQATQWRIAEGDDDAAKGLLAIYLDLTAQTEAERAAQHTWEQAVDRFQAAVVALDAVPGPVDFDENCPEYVAFVVAQMELLDTTAPDAKAMAYKLQVILNYGHVEEKDDNTDNPAFLLRALDDHAIDGAGPVARLLRDAYHLAGLPHRAAMLEPRA